MKILHWLVLGVTQLWALHMSDVPIWNDSLEILDSQDSGTIFGLDTNRIQVNGYKSIAITAGEGGMDLQQAMRIEVQGELAPDWFINARLVDEGLGQGNLRVTTLEQVDEMFLEILHGKSWLRMGDIASMAESTFLVAPWSAHRTQGVAVGMQEEQAGRSFAWGRDQILRGAYEFEIQGVQRQGYLVSADGYRVLVPNSLRVWKNGLPLAVGVDYQVREVGGWLDFLPVCVLLPGDRIRVEFEEYGQGESRNFGEAWAWQNFSRGAMHAAVRYFQGDSSTPQPSGLGALQGSLKLGSGKMMWELQSAQNGGLRGGALAVNSEFPSAVGLWKLQGIWEHRNFWENPYLVENALWSNQALQAEYGVVVDSVEGMRGMARSAWQGAWENQGLSWSVHGLSMDRQWLAQNLQIGVQKYGYGGELAWLNSLWNQGVRADFHVQPQREGLIPFWKTQGRWLQDDSTHSWQANSSAGLLFPLNQGVEGFWQNDVRRVVELNQDSLWVMSSAWHVKQNWSQGHWASDVQIMRQKQNQGSATEWNSSHEVRMDYAHAGWGIKQSAQWAGTRTWAPVYRLVAPGTGDVIFDSLSGQYVEGVDQGDYVRDGESPADSLPSMQEGRSIWHGDFWLGALASHGILRDLRWQGNLDWNLQDSASMPWNPTAKWDSLRVGNFAGHLQMDWMLPDSLWGISCWTDREKSVEHQWLSSQQELTRWGALTQTLLGQKWLLKLNYSQEQRKILEPTQWDWTLQEWTPEFAWRMPWQFTWGGFWSVRKSQDFQWQQPNLRIEWRYRKEGKVRLDVSRTTVESTSINLPWSLSQGYATGSTWRILLESEWRAKDNLEFHMQWLWRNTQRFSMDARAIF